ncbi:MAG: entericidin A/B family lipoprotein [Paracoccaceae bacterium]|nr:entericidin A/B family lipoprotein [Paracoccaceae bacterium]
MLRIVALLSVLLALAACETTKGVGRDVQNAGEALENAVE